jgi:hypothetical protein
VAPGWTSWLQSGLILVGQAAGLWTGWRETRALGGGDRAALTAYAPTAVLLTLAAFAFLRLYAA